ncbi:hypothetical protein Pen01_55970 [Phytomonospora endophytica]|nr:hypothetical protein Pen01_55970 [Phytomonospora endophytica]
MPVSERFAVDDARDAVSRVGVMGVRRTEVRPGDQHEHHDHGDRLEESAGVSPSHRSPIAHGNDANFPAAFRRP